MRRRLPDGAVVRPHFLLRGVYRAAGQRAHYYGPGDRLTLSECRHLHRRLISLKSLAARRELVGLPLPHPAE